MQFHVQKETKQNLLYTVKSVYIEHSRKEKVYAGVQYIQVESIWRSVEIEKKSKVNR